MKQAYSLNKKEESLNSNSPSHTIHNLKKTNVC